MKELKTAKFWMALVAILFNIQMAAFSHVLMGQVAHCAMATLIVVVYIISQSSVETADKCAETIDIVEACLERSGIDLDAKEGDE